MKFIHAIVITQRERNLTPKEYMSDWNALISADYMIHTLFSEFTQDLLMLNDNIHQPIETMIEQFLCGVEFASNEENEVEYICITVKDNENPYDWRTVRQYIRENKYEIIKSI